MNGNGLFFTIVVIFVYFLPIIIAGGRKHRSGLAIGAVNILLGWTLLGWLWAFIWSLTGNVRSTNAVEQRLP